MNGVYLVELLTAFVLQLIVGYIVGAIIGLKKRPRAAFIGMLVGSFIMAFLGCGPWPIRNYGPLVIWLFTATVFWLNRSRTKRVQNSGNRTSNTPS